VSAAGAVDALATSGPLAVLLGLAVYTLWATLRKLRKHYEGDPDDPEKHPGLIRTMDREARAREDKIREAAAKELAEERAETVRAFGRLEVLLRSLAEKATEAENGDG